MRSRCFGISFSKEKTFGSFVEEGEERGLRQVGLG